MDDRIRGVSRRDWLRWASMWSAAGLAACGGGSEGEGGTPAPSPAPAPAPAGPAPGGSAPGGGAAGTAISPAQRAASLQALETRLSELYDPATGRVQADAVLTWLSQQAVFQRVGYSATRDAYAIFTDGRKLIVNTNTRADTQGVTRAPLSVPAPLQRAHATARPRAAQLPATYEAGIPSSQMRFMNTWFGTELDFPAPGVWCRDGVSSFTDLGAIESSAEGLGYRSIAPLKDGPVQLANSVEGLKNVRGDGVFCWTTHGGTLDDAGNIVLGLMTSTTAYQETVEVEYAGEFAEDTLIYYTGPLCIHPTACGRTTHYTRLAITPKFITKYAWSFDPYSLVFVNACASALPPMKQAFLNAGASVYVGWTQPVRLWAMLGAASDFFSLMLGLNENVGGGYVDQALRPRQRPYDWGAVMDLLHSRGGPARYEDAEDGLVELEPTLNTSVPVGFLAMRPSIFSMSFNETKSELTLIGGMFGTKPGGAVIGTDMPCPTIDICSHYGNAADWRVSGPVALQRVDDWASENLRFQVPREGPGSAGLVQVEADGRWSNAAQLTRVSGPLAATRTYGGSLRVDVTGSVSFRADFRSRRLEPAAEPAVVPEVVCVSSPLARGTFQASGRHEYAEGDGTVTIEWSGSGNLGPLSPEQSQVFLSGTIALPSRTGRFLVQFLGSGIVETRTVSRPNQAPTVTVRTLSFGVASDASAGDPRSVTLAFTPQFGAEAATQVHAGAGLYGGAPSTTTLTCGPFTAEFPPDDEKGGR